jgi:Glu-tRNA(Gln) amidotransferase subunit E-like FAD-binding protein
MRLIEGSKVIPFLRNVLKGLEEKEHDVPELSDELISKALNYILGNTFARNVMKELSSQRQNQDSMLCL